MKLHTILSTGTLGMAGLVAAGLLSTPGATTVAAEDRFAKRDEDAAEVVLVADDDDDDDTREGDRSRSRRDGTGTGAVTGRDDSRERRVVDMTRDGKGGLKKDWSQRQTNDRSRHNTRR